MECPRCGSTLERYALQGREAVACESCGYIGVPVEHRGELAEFESWDEAIDRFQQSTPVEAGTTETREDDPTAVFDADGTGDGSGNASPTVVRIESTPVESVVENHNGNVACEVCGKSFDEQAQLNGHLSVHSSGKNDN